MRYSSRLISVGWPSYYMASSKNKPLVQKKIVLNKEHGEFLEVAIGEIWEQDGKIYYVISFGGGKEAIMVGEEEYEKFVDLELKFSGSSLENSRSRCSRRNRTQRVPISLD